MGLARLRWLALAGVCAWLMLSARLVQVQAWRHDAYAVRAKEQHERLRDVDAQRGRILDRRGRELALDVRSVSFYCNPSTLENRDEVAHHFGQLRGTDGEALRRQLQSSRSFVYIARQVDEHQLAALETRTFKNVLQHPETGRLYPYGPLGGQVLGFTDVDNHGREGLELTLDDDLTERRGQAVSFVDNRGRALAYREEQRRVAADGRSVKLTIDAVYQDVLEEELLRAMHDSDSQSAMGIVANPATGEILAMASVPLFDPNDPGGAQPQLRRNRVVTDPFEPGSTLKAVTAAAVFDKGRAQPGTRVFCESGALELANGDTIRDLSPHGWLTSRQVLVKSSNIGAVKLARRLGRGEFYDYLRSFGFGTRTGIGLPAESAGLLRNAGQWSERSLETIAIGQEISVTAIQMVQAFGAIANGGVLMAPVIVKEVTGPDGEVSQRARPRAVRRVISERTAADVRAILAGVVSDGTGRRAQIRGVTVAGKTGTAQRVSADGVGYAEDEHVVSFIGFLPAEQPELLCLIVIDNPRREKWGGVVAAPAFQRTMARIYALERHDGRSGRRGNGVLSEPVNGTGVVAKVIPDLRGMSESLARYHCDVRGIALQVEGVGSTVVAQDPPPGVRQYAPVIKLSLAGPEKASTIGLAVTPIRQLLVLRKLAAPELAFSLH